MPEPGAGFSRRGEGAERRAVFWGTGRGRCAPRRLRPRVAVHLPALHPGRPAGYCNTSTQTCAGAGQGVVCVSTP